MHLTLSFAFTSARRASNVITVVAQPLLAAQCSAVPLPCASAAAAAAAAIVTTRRDADHACTLTWPSALTSAPRSSSSDTTDAASTRAALCSGVSEGANDDSRSFARSASRLPRSARMRRAADTHHFPQAHVSAVVEQRRHDAAEAAAGRHVHGG